MAYPHEIHESPFPFGLGDYGDLGELGEDTIVTPPVPVPVPTLFQTIWNFIKSPLGIAAVIGGVYLWYRSEDILRK